MRGTRHFKDRMQTLKITTPEKNLCLVLTKRITIKLVKIGFNSIFYKKHFK